MGNLSRLLLRVFSVLIFTAVALFLAFCLLYRFPFISGSDIANDLKAAQIRKVKPGMTMQEVLNLWGQPYEYHTGHELHNISCQRPKAFEFIVTDRTNVEREIKAVFNDTNYCCEGNREDIAAARITLQYTKPVRFVAHPMLWVHFDDHYRVRSVFAKKYAWFDDYAIYAVSSKSCETGEIDTSNEYFITKEFGECF